MDWYIEYLEHLTGYVRKHTGINDIYILEDKGEGLRGVIEPSDINQGGPNRVGREFTIILRLIAPYVQWKQLFQKMGIAEDKLNECDTVNENQTIRLKCLIGTWTRIPDETNIVYENNLTLRGVRLGA